MKKKKALIVGASYLFVTEEGLHAVELVMDDGRTVTHEFTDYPSPAAFGTYGKPVTFWRFCNGAKSDDHRVAEAVRFISSKEKYFSAAGLDDTGLAFWTCSAIGQLADDGVPDQLLSQIHSAYLAEKDRREAIQDKELRESPLKASLLSLWAHRVKTVLGLPDLHTWKLRWIWTNIQAGREPSEDGPPPWPEGGAHA